MKYQRQKSVFCLKKKKYKFYEYILGLRTGEDAMEKHNKIFIKIQLEKDETTGNLSMKTQFDLNAPNFYQDKNGISWSPTQEEMDFIYQAFELMPNIKNKNFYNEPKIKTEKEESLSEEEEQIEEKNREEPPTSRTPPERATRTPEPAPTKKGDSDGVIITADASAVDEIIKRKKNADGVIVEADEETIVDRVLKHKKRGSW